MAGIPPQALNYEGMGQSSIAGPRYRYTGLRLLLLSALGFSLSVSLVIFALDVVSGVDPHKAKLEGKGAVKRGNTFASGLSSDEQQGQEVLGMVIATLLLGGVALAVYPLARTRRVPRNTKVVLMLIGWLIGFALLAPVLALLLKASDLIS